MSALVLPRGHLPQIVLAEALLVVVNRTALCVRDVRRINRQIALLRHDWSVRSADASLILGFLAEHGDTLDLAQRDGAQTALRELLRGGLA